jgi:tryptophanyl-tRNA synthetase
MMSFLSISFSALAAGRAFILTGAYNKMSSSETESLICLTNKSLVKLVKVVKSTKAPCNTVEN